MCFSWLFEKKKKAEEVKKEYVDKELIREANHLMHAVHRAPKKVGELERLLAIVQAKLNKAISSGSVKNKAKVNSRIQRAKNAVDKLRDEQRKERRKVLREQRKTIKSLKAA